MADMTKPSLGLLVKLGSIAVHADEILSPHREAVDVDAIRSLLEDVEVREWLAQMSKAAFLPVKRN